MEQLELSEIQGFLIKNYVEMPFSNYYLLEIENAGKVKGYLKEIAKEITSVSGSPNDFYLNIGFTAAGLSALGLHEKNIHSFIREFREGMVTPHRQRLLGDHESSDPEKWAWEAQPINRYI